MTLKDPWLLPSGVEEVLPPEAGQIELLRRRLLDLFDSWGYEFVIPPLIEYLDSLLTGVGTDLDLQTFKVTDQLTGRMMGIRADMTPQVARIDAHRLKCNVPARLCYLGPILWALPFNTGGSRNPLQIGAELYGHRGLESDVEILCLMLDTLKTAGVSPLYVDLGHVGVVRGLVRQARIDEGQEELLFDGLQRKAASEVQAFLTEWNVEKGTAAMISALCDLNGDMSVSEHAAIVLQNADDSVRHALDELVQIAGIVGQRVPAVRWHIDLAELRGYRYHTGVVFSAYTSGQGQSVARGGRYDDIGQVFGWARPATGFSADLKQLVGLTSRQSIPARGIYAPWSDSPTLFDVIAQLRSEGKRVVQALPGRTDSPQDLKCDKKLELKRGRWVIINV